MKTNKTLNELFMMAELGETKNFIENSSKKEILDAIEVVFNEGLKGTCLSGWESMLDAYGFSLESLEGKVTEEDVLMRLDETTFNCAICGWWYGIEEQEDLDDEAVCTGCYEEEMEE